MNVRLVTLAGSGISAVWLLLGVRSDLDVRREQAATTIRVGPNVHVSGDRPTTPHVEPFLAIHPSNPCHLVVGTIVGRWTCSVLVSTDGGREWTRTDPGPLRALAHCGDP